jgi:phosphate starvation-inducible PhoH-like protein
LDVPINTSIEVPSTQVLLALSGPQSNLLDEVARQSGADVSLRGNTILVAGEPAAVTLAERFLRDAAELVGKGFDIGPNDVAGSMRGLRADPARSLVELLDETNIVTAR